MSEQVKWTLNIEVVDGPKMSASKTETVDAYDKIEAEIPKKQNGAETKTVEVQPGGAGKVQFLLIKSSAYGEKLTYKAQDDTGDSAIIKLDSIQLLIGAGAVGLLGKAPQKLIFSNELDQTASIEILVGRKATT